MNILYKRFLDLFLLDLILRFLALEERADLDTLDMDTLSGILTAYEMRISGETSSRKEATFKAATKEKKKKEEEVNHSEK